MSRTKKIEERSAEEILRDVLSYLNDFDGADFELLTPERMSEFVCKLYNEVQKAMRALKRK